MRHALIIDDNMIISRAIQSYLEPLGFTSFDHTWTENQALAAAHKHCPDLVVIGDDIEIGSALRAARQIAEDGNIPVLMVTGKPWRATDTLEQPTSISGPFMLNQIEQAVDLALAR